MTTTTTTTTTTARRLLHSSTAAQASADFEPGDDDGPNAAAGTATASQKSNSLGARGPTPAILQSLNRVAAHQRESSSIRPPPPSAPSSSSSSSPSAATAAASDPRRGRMPDMFNRFVHREFDNPQPNSADDMQRALRRHQATQPLTDNDYDDEVSSSYSPPSGVLPHGYGRGRPQQRLPIGFANPSAAPPMPSWSRTTTRYGPPPPTEYLLPGSPGAEVGGELSSPAPASGSSIPPLRPSLGRSVAIGPNHGIDLARGLVILKSSLAQNQIRISALRQRFHERPGLKRKRLKSERYRARFLKGFRRMVSQVQHMRRQGW